MLFLQEAVDASYDSTPASSLTESTERHPESHGLVALATVQLAADRNRQAQCVEMQQLAIQWQKRFA